MDITTEGRINIGIALFVIGLCIPLILRKIPMNHVYGFRTRLALQSDENWYDINAAGGKALMVATLPLLIAGIIQVFAPDNAGPAYGYLSFTFVCIPLGCLWHCLRGRKKIV